MPIDISKISGNASPEIKRVVGNPVFLRRPPSAIPAFGEIISQRIQVTEVSIDKKQEEPQKLEARVVCELTVEDDMVNGGGKIHGGCSAYLVDICSSLVIIAIRMHEAADRTPTVSQALNMVYHSPADIGDKLRIVNTTMTVGARAMSARTEIWNTTHHRLVASGVHIKMNPSLPKANL